MNEDFWKEFPDGKITKEAFSDYYQLSSNNGQETIADCKYTINRSNDI